MTDLSYKDEKGLDVFTARYLRNKKTCCKTQCLHCPYGYTLETLGLKFVPVTLDTLDSANAIISPKGDEQEGASLASSLLASAYGSPKKKISVSPQNIDKFFFIELKDKCCGVVKKGILQFSELYLLEYFKDQGLDLHTVNRYYDDLEVFTR